MKYILYILTLTFSVSAYAHSSLRGRVSDENGYLLANALVQLHSNGRFNYTDASGAFEFKNLDPGQYTLEVTLLGFHKTVKEIQIGSEEVMEVAVVLASSNIELSEVVVTPSRQSGINTINAIDFPLRPINTTQDLLRLVPGLFIAQHAGGGKAEQIFLRGFDVDHGTDVAISVDGMPVNMVSHAHGQGYADLHFVIPETIENLTLSKGPYDARNGDFNTAGAVRFQTRKFLQKNFAKVEAGNFNTFRGVLMANLLGSNIDTTAPHHAYIATEYFMTRGFFESPQNFNRLNMLGKYTGQLSAASLVSASVSAFSSQWDASGQIPERAVAAGLISRFGSLDNTEGGNTSRYNVNLALEKTLNNGATFRNQVFYSKYNFSLFSNFTFFLEDSINGDQIHQFESRSIVGYNGSYSQSLWAGAVEAKTTIGAGLRSDRVRDIGLAHSLRRRWLNDIRRGDLEEDNVNLYVDESFLISPKITLNIGARLDHFRFRYNSTLTDTLTQPVSKSIVSPKLNLYVVPLQDVQLYASAGTGFHSNDARVVTQERNSPTLPRAIGLDLGINVKTFGKLFLNAAVWTLNLESEYVYVGDAGIVEPSGRSHRKGIDLSARYQIMPWLFADVDFNITQPKLIGEPESNNRIPLAPRITSIGGLSVKSFAGWNGSLRYRYIGDRPAIEDNSIVASGYCIVDAVANYTIKNLTLGLSIENLFDVAWKEAQFATESRLQGEAEPVNEIHYTPGIPFFLKGIVSYSF